MGQHSTGTRWRKPKTTCAVSLKVVLPHPSKRMQGKGSRTRSMNETIWAVFVV